MVDAPILKAAGEGIPGSTSQKDHQKSFYKIYQKYHKNLVEKIGKLVDLPILKSPQKGMPLPLHFSKSRSGTSRQPLKN